MKAAEARQEAEIAAMQALIAAGRSPAQAGVDAVRFVDELETAQRNRREAQKEARVAAQRLRDRARRPVRGEP